MDPGAVRVALQGGWLGVPGTARGPLGAGCRVNQLVRAVWGTFVLAAWAHTTLAHPPHHVNKAWLSIHGNPAWPSCTPLKTLSPQVETGSAITWKYPSVILVGDNSVGEFYSVALTNNMQQVGVLRRCE